MKKMTYQEIIKLAEELGIPTTWTTLRGKIRPVPTRNLCSAIRYELDRERKGFAEQTNLKKRGIL